MNHYPARQRYARIEGMSFYNAPRIYTRRTILLFAITCFAAGFCAAVWTVGMIATAP